jgi:hypothetical protein
MRIESPLQREYIITEAEEFLVSNKFGTRERSMGAENHHVSAPTGKL